MSTPLHSRHKPSRLIGSDKETGLNMLAQTLKNTLTTLGLASVGTAALVGAHHLGRKQYNSQARLTDYRDGLRQALGKVTAATPIVTPSDAPANLVQSQARLNNSSVTWISGVAELTTSEFAVVGLNAAREIVWQSAMPERVHDLLIQPLASKALQAPHVAVMGRRPSEWFWILDAHSGEVVHSIKAQTDRHFYGHACYSLQGDLLYVTENNTADFSGRIGIYEVASGYKKIAEYASHGIGPHEIVMHPDGESLLIANGGIKTERASREELNLDSMQPSLVYLNRHTGQLLQQVFPAHNQMSVRHLAMHDNGSVIIGIQFQGERHLSVPMVLTHRRGEPKFTELQIAKDDSKGWHRFHHYIASVAVDSKHNLACATSPIGGCAAVFDLSTGMMIGDAPLADCAGVTTWPSQTQYQATQQIPSGLPLFLVSDGQGYLSSIGVDQAAYPQSIWVEKKHQSYAFDNHLTTLGTVDS